MPRDPFRNFNTYKIDPLSEIRNAGIVTNGDVYWVSSVLDANHTTRRNDMGRKEVKETLQAAIDAARDNGNDHILVIPTDSGTVVPLGTAVDINKDRLHILGVGNNPAPVGYNGLTFRGYVAANGIDTELVNVTGAGVELAGLKFLGTSGTADGGTITAHLRLGTAASGTPHGFYAHDLHVENTQAAADNGTAPIVVISGDVAGGIQGLRLERVWLGDTAWAPTAIISVSGTAGPTRLTIKDSTLVMHAQATSSSFAVLGTGDTDYVVIENTLFINKNSGTLPASAITGAAKANNPIALRRCGYINVSQAGTDTEAYKIPAYSGTQAAVFDPGIGIGTAALIPS